MTTASGTNVDAAEVAKFNAIASRWWDRDGEFKPLHDINPLRVDYIEARSNGLHGKQVVDIGCGGGILSEAMAARGGQVTGIDMAEAALQVARLHLHASGLQVNYQLMAAEQLATQQPGQFDVVTCMELLEHVPDPAALVAACARLVKPGGQVFLSTLNRTAKAYLLAVIGAEYLLRMLPRGTHDYQKFIRPSELGHWLRDSALELRDIRGISYNPLSRRYALGRDIDVNYLVHATRPGA
ncbi:MAG: bifunctional 2-polyprenyl-6-hydroxyphenol methylase/3-demethylubiquinol 3-O-methyltransferase UbiG [Gammaproteobacteria bacterium]|nr:bifunctional 2-polyprenyl-6-hydroxyphenol methylase/3-demethylubiquinol 3-O-methyltransferase UbiG [Gammaproteobacteria bacterium]